MYNVTVQLASHVDVLYNVKFHSALIVPNGVPNGDQHVDLEHIFK